LINPIPAWKKALRKALLTAVYRSVDHAFYVGQANKRYFLWSGLKESQLTLAPHAVDNEFFMRDDETRTKEAMQIRASLGISEEATVFLFVGKLEPLKQPTMLAHAFEQFLKSEPRPVAHLVFVGSGVLERELKTEFGKNPQIHFVGFQNQSQMPIWYRVGDTLCLASTTETWGLAVNEAMACGCTAIVSDRVGCAEDIVGPNSNCQIVSSNNRDGWSLALNDKIGSNRIKRNTLKDWVGNWNLLHFKNALQEGLDH
ncbi:MAG: glycosyltransferase family 4 protein, partial [Pseudomonadales bacterium]